MARPKSLASRVNDGKAAWINARKAGNRAAANRAEQELRRLLHEQGNSWDKFYADYILGGHS